MMKTFVLSLFDFSLARMCLSILFCGLALSISAAAQPAMSRGEQRLSASYDECMQRAVNAFTNEGWSNIGKGGAFVNAFKDNHGAYIMCNVAPENKIWVNIVVASLSQDNNVPGAERVKLQKWMDQPVSSTTTGPGNSTRWVYRDGSFSDTHIYYADGTVKSGGVTGTWSVVGNELVTQWPNGWSNRFLWNQSGQLTGTAFGPSGEKHSITLTRQ